jgi:F420H(2)-dependent quinone reductase
MNQAQFLYLTTIGWKKTGRQHRVGIWFVDYNDKCYITSERLNRAHWVQNIKHNPSFIYCT